MTALRMFECRPRFSYYEPAREFGGHKPIVVLALIIPFFYAFNLTIAEGFDSGIFCSASPGSTDTLRLDNI